jgi:glycosyltransferase involved in cell wall biosynthesis
LKDEVEQPVGEQMDDAVRLSVVIPVYNEADTIGKVIRRVLECGFETEVIVVDDASTDDTARYLRSLEDPRVHCFYHAVNRGKGAALRTGFAAARNPYVVVQDADLEYDPRDYRQLLEALLDGRADMVYGSRFLGGPHRVLFFWHYVGNRLLTLASDMMCNLNLTDMETGMKAFRRDKLMTLKLSADRFTFEPEITAKAARARWRVYEVPISYSGRTYAEGKKIGWRDAIAAMAAILYYRFAD